MMGQLVDGTAKLFYEFSLEAMVPQDRTKLFRNIQSCRVERGSCLRSSGFRARFH